MSSTPAAHDVHIWFRDTTSAPVAAVESARETLSRDECARADRFHFDADRRDYILAHDLLRRCLSRYRPISPSAWDFRADAAGKPAVSDSSLSFNLSHTRGLVACAIGNGPAIGIDAESATRIGDVGSIADGCFSSEETASLAQCRDEEARTLRFLEMWTLKEAFVKALGVGLALPLDSMSFTLDRHGLIVFAPPPGFAASEWHFALFEPADHARLAVAVRSPRVPHLIAHDATPTDTDVDGPPLTPVRLSVPTPHSSGDRSTSST